MKKILIINGHPNKTSFCSAIAGTYARAAAAAGNEVDLLNLYEMQFDPNFTGSYEKESVQAEPDILNARKKISDAQHLLIVHPVWWGSVPALLKGFFDKTLVPGFAFKYRKNSIRWDKLLAGKTASIIYTSDTPPWFYRLVYQAPSVNMLRKRVLHFCGIKTNRVIGFGPMRHSSPQKRADWLKQTEKLGFAAG